MCNDETTEIFYSQDAIKAQSIIGPTLSIDNGDLEKGFTDCDHVIEGEMRTGAQVCIHHRVTKI